MKGININMNFRKKLTAAVLSAAICIPGISVSAYDLPHDFWGLNEKYSAAVDSKNYSETAYYGSKIVDLISGEPSNEQTDNIVGSRAYEAAFAYFFTGDYQNAAKYFNTYIPYGEKMGWTDGVRIAKEYVKQLSSSLDIYKHTEQIQKYYGAKNEPQGVLSGEISEKTQDGDSMVLLYLEYGYSDELNWAKVVFDNARRDGKAVELAVNFPNQGDTARSVSAADSYLAQLYSLVSQYTDVPVFCRIGAEVNIWGNSCTPDEFKNAFLTIANRMKTLQNTAILWSIAHTDRWYSSEWPYTADDFYPGDENVDYAGITIYCNKYFEGRTWDGTEKFNEICFKTGYSADPVLMIKDFVEKYGSRKPIVISECGSAYYTQGSINQNHQDWAAEHLKEIYSYVPMVYPQVKLIAYFNKQITHETNWYDLDSSAPLKAAYSEMNMKPWFIKNNFANKSGVFFERLGGSDITDNSVTLSAYPHIYGSDYTKVTYYLDDTAAASSDTVPYTVQLSLAGAHKLTVTAQGSTGEQVTREYSITGTGSTDTPTDDNSLFNDTSSLSEVQKNALKKVYDSGIITGYDDNSVRPYNTITRAEFAAMVCRLMNYTADENCTFNDAANHWAAKYIKACVDAGAINGIGNNNFAPDSNITIEQALKIITVVCGMASPDAKYPDGFVAAAVSNALTDNITSNVMSSDLKRIDAAMIMSKTNIN